MPAIDVSELISDPDFSTTIGIVRSINSINARGRTDVVEEYEDGVVAVVTQGGGQTLALLADGSRISDSIKVYCKRPLRAATELYRADIVVWKGARFLVKVSKDWSDWGEGFYIATCEFLARPNPDAG